MRIVVFGLGCVGTVCAACLAEQGHDVIAVETSSRKVDLVSSGRSPVIEPGLDVLVRRLVDQGRLTATTTGAEAIASCDMSFICVGTPSRASGEPSLDAVNAVIDEIAHAISPTRRRHTIVLRSTVPPGTTRALAARLAVAAKAAVVDVAFNPEFLREGSAVSDYRNPAKTIVGAIDASTATEVMALYADLPGAKISTQLEVAELAKYADNAWHALKVAFGNEIGTIAKAFDLNGHDVMDILTSDGHLNISPAYMRPGFAFGGPCLPKDLRALGWMGHKLAVSLPVLDHILDSNRAVIERGAAWIVSRARKRVAFLGISFKPETDDVRESPFVTLVARLIEEGFEVRIFDPNVHIADLIGANRDYLLEMLPNLADLSTTSAAAAIGWADTVVVTAADPSYAAAIAQARPDQTVLDLAGWPSGESKRRMEGFLW
jgi:GDP-mannose 6-dehydrogenase